MSMTINSTSYTDIRFKNPQADNLDSGGKGSSLSSNRTGTVSEGAAATDAGSQRGAGQAGSPMSFASSRVDTVEISAEGRAFTARAQAQKSEVGAAQEYQYEAGDLSEYTNSELKSMYYRGEITLQEYEDETGETLE